MSPTPTAVAAVAPRMRRCAITLVEMTLGLALAAIVVFMVLRAYYMAQENQRVHATNQQLGQMFSAVNSVFPLSTNYSTLSNSMIAKAMPPSLVGNDQQGFTPISNPFRGMAYTFGGAVNNDAGTFAIGMDGLTVDACTRIANNFTGYKNLLQVTIYDMNFSPTGGPYTTFPVNATAAAQACAAAGASTNGRVAVEYDFGAFGQVASNGGGGGGNGGSGGGGGGGSISINGQTLTVAEMQTDCGSAAWVAANDPYNSGCATAFINNGLGPYPGPTGP